MNRLTLSLIIIISTIVIAFVLLSMMPYLSTVEGREGARPREGITIVHSTNINVKMEYYIVTTRDTNLIGVRISPNPIVNTIKPTIVGIYFPYHVKLNQTYNAKYTDYTTWHESENEYEHGTAFVWDIPCQNSNNCYLYKSQDVEFILDPSIKFDSKDAYRHGIKIRFDNTNGIASDFFNKFEEPKNLAYGVEYAKVQATIIIPENAQQIHTIPLPQPNMFHNIGADYSNTQLDWNVTKDSRTFFVDFEMPNERINFEEKQNQFTALGLFVGLVTGGLGIAVAIFYGKTDNKANSSSTTHHTSTYSFKNDTDVKTTINKQITTRLIEQKYLAIIFMIITIIVFASVYLNSSTHEISNNVTLVVEIGVGFIMAVVIYGISRRSEIEIENKVNGVFDIVQERESFRKKQASSIEVFLLNVFRNIETSVELILNNAYLYENSDESIREFYKQKVVSECKQIERQAEENLDNPSIISPEFFDLDTIRRFKTLSVLCKSQPIFNHEENTVNVDFCDVIKKMIELWIEDFSQKVQSKIETTRVQLESNMDTLSISVSSDRTVYPLDSMIHVQANVPFIVHGETITFEIFNSDRKLLLSKEIDPEKYGKLESEEANTFTVSFKMKGNEWKIDEEYIVRATYASSYSEDSFLVDQRMPAVQSDKSVYMINSDMIITVIDPDADKDSEAIDYVGDREDSKLIIELPYGKIDGYKLTETGNSTGIFQGIIGILGIRKDGSVVERIIDGKIINKIQGIGPEDGFIGGHPGQEIIISYKNNTGTAYLTIFVSNFGASVELDKKVYRPGDKVFLTIIAPDFNLNSEIIEEIGQKPESIIRIRTSKDELLNYKLVETGPDTGIFTGELYLLDSQEKPSESQTMFGPNDGRIACSNDDFIEVIFNLYGYEEVIGKALIKS